jgi:uncharacterized repeat protein (TIGR02543 family)
VIIKEGKKVSKPENPQRDNYRFVDWYKDILGREEFDFEGTVQNDVILYAKWTNAKTIYYDSPDADFNYENVFRAIFRNEIDNGSLFSKLERIYESEEGHILHFIWNYNTDISQRVYQLKHTTNEGINARNEDDWPVAIHIDGVIVRGEYWTYLLTKTGGNTSSKDNDYVSFIDLSRPLVNIPFWFDGKGVYCDPDNYYNRPPSTETMWGVKQQDELHNMYSRLDDVYMRIYIKTFGVDRIECPEWETSNLWPHRYSNKTFYFKESKITN